jgi:parallel beta-helix repeat protein
MRIIKLLTAGVAIAALAFVPLGTVFANGGGWGHHNKVITVKPGDLALPPGPTTTQDTWYFYNDNTDTPSTAEVPGSYEFVNGPSDPPHGYGSLKFTPGAGDRWNIATNQFAGKDLDELDKLAMTLYRPSTSADESLFFNFDVDFDNTAAGGYQGRLVYVPDDNGTVNEDVWQKWDMDEGMWRWSGYTANGNKWLDNDTDELRAWSEIIAAFPNAEVFNESFTGQTLVRGGHPGPAGLEGYVDSVTVNHKTYDFENDDCIFVTHGNMYKLKNDCVTTQTILIPDGMTLLGGWHTITAKDPAGGHFLGAVVKNGGDEASVKNLKISADNLAAACDADNDRLRGILFDGASGVIEHNMVLALNQGPSGSGCQEGNAFEARNAPFDGTHPGTKHVVFKGNYAAKYMKSGIVANGDLTAKIKHNNIRSSHLDTTTASNSIQLAFGASGEVQDNWVGGNQWCGAENTVATAMLIYQAGSVEVKSNHIYGNSDVGIYLDYTGHAKVKNNKVKDQGTDCNVNGYDIGIGNYPAVGATYQIRHNRIHGFTTPTEGI